MTDEQLDAITPSLLDGRPNTYTFTKSIAEYVIASEAKGLPLAIFRPAIVAGSYREPYPVSQYNVYIYFFSCTLTACMIHCCSFYMRAGWTASMDLLEYLWL